MSGMTAFFAILAVGAMAVAAAFFGLWMYQRQRLSDLRAQAKALEQYASQLHARATKAESQFAKAASAYASLREKATAKINAALAQAGDWRKRYQRVAHWDEVQDAVEAAERADREVQALSERADALRNVIDGYGSRYVVPPQSILDDLAEEGAHLDAGERLKAARAVSRELARSGKAAHCVDPDPTRARAVVDCLVDAFNARAEPILTAIRADNIGTVRQKLRDAFVLVNEYGGRLGGGRITDEYLQSRLAELKWAAVIQKHKDRDRDEQRQMKERLREEAKAQREFERADREARKREQAVERERQAIEAAREVAILEERARQEARLRAELERVGAEQRAQVEARMRAEMEQQVLATSAKYESQMAEADARIKELEAQRERAKSMAQQTRKGTVYVISNIGSLGEGVYKIGQTRRLDPMERVWELGDASVPFDFDVHALVETDDAPGLEARLHQRFVLNQVNKMNWRKEFFRVPLEEVRGEFRRIGLSAVWTMTSEAQQYRETVALESQMAVDPGLRARWVEEQTGLAAEEIERWQVAGNAGSPAVDAGVDNE
jgi:hypothetical protein